MESMSIVFAWACFLRCDGLLPGIDDLEASTDGGRSVPVRRAFISADVWSNFPLPGWLKSFLEISIMG